MTRQLKTTDKEVILKTDRVKKRHITYSRTKIRMTVNFLPEIMQVIRQWSNIFKIFKRI